MYASLSTADLAQELRADVESAPSARAAEIIASYAATVAAIAPAPDMYSAAMREFDSRDLTAAGRRYLWSETTGDSALGDEAAERATIAAAQAGDRDARAAILAAYMPLIKGMQRRHAGDAGWREEVRQAAVVGLFEAVAAFDVAKAGNARLGGLAPRYIADAVSELYAGRFMLSVPKADRLAYGKARAAAGAQDGEEFGDASNDAAAALAPEFGLSTEDYRVIHLAATYTGIATPREGDEDAEERDADALTIEVQVPAPITLATVTAIRTAAGLSDKESAAIDAVHGLNGCAQQTREEAAKSLGLEKRRLVQLLNGYSLRGKAYPGAFAKLRAAAEALGLVPAQRGDATEYLTWPADVCTEADVTLSALTVRQHRRVTGWWHYARAIEARRAITATTNAAMEAARLRASAGLSR